MHVNFIAPRAGSSEHVLCEAELVFDEGEPLAGMRLVGFALWRGEDGRIHVSLPSRAVGVGSERRFLDYLRGDMVATLRLRAFAADAFDAQGTDALADAVAASSPRESRE